ncbi:hypothetical protein NIES4075_11200 [Tolypothrix sp. NIES-4075]|nr:hypothetical protein NIES4075_11200 [Tolypothrix sp. NIES-4075]
MPAQFTKAKSLKVLLLVNIRIRRDNSNVNIDALSLM